MSMKIAILTFTASDNYGQRLQNYALQELLSKNRNEVQTKTNESKDINGISHFIEHVNFKGTKTRTAFDISDETDRIGSTVNAFTSKECTWI